MKHILGSILESNLTKKINNKSILKTLISINHLPDSENLNTRSLYGMIQISNQCISVYKIEKFYDSLTNIKGNVTKETRFDFPGLNDIAEGKHTIEEVTQMIDDFCDKLKEPHFIMDQFYIEGFSEAQLISYDDVIDVIGYVCNNDFRSISNRLIGTIRNLKPEDFVIFTAKRCDLGKEKERLRFFCFKDHFTILMEDDNAGYYEKTYYNNDGVQLVNKMIEEAQLGEWEKFIYREFTSEAYFKEDEEACAKAGSNYDITPLYIKTINLKQVYSILKNYYN